MIDNWKRKWILNITDPTKFRTSNNYYLEKLHTYYLNVFHMCNPVNWFWNHLEESYALITYSPIQNCLRIRTIKTHFTISFPLWLHDHFLIQNATVIHRHAIDPPSANVYYIEMIRRQSLLKSTYLFLGCLFDGHVPFPTIRQL